MLFAGASLAAAWVAIDLVTHATPAAAAEVVDILPNGDGPSVIPLVASIVDPVVDLVAPVAVPLVSGVADPLAPVLEPVRTIVDEVAVPVATAVVSPIIEDIVVPLAQTVPLSQIVPAVQALVPAVQLALPVALEPVTAWLGRGMILGGGLLLGGALLSAVSVPPPAPNGGQRRAPLQPPMPSGELAGVFALIGELNSGVPTAFGALRAAAPGAVGLPASPTYASDTTPD